MVKWHFYEGMNSEWHWYKLDDEREIAASSDCAFQDLDACMRNARDAGFDETEFLVHTRGIQEHLLTGRSSQRI